MKFKGVQKGEISKYLIFANILRKIRPRISHFSKQKLCGVCAVIAKTFSEALVGENGNVGAKG